MLPGTPLAELDMAEPNAIGAEFLRWEVATAAAGVLMSINPFDEPNVQQAKDATRQLLDRTLGRLDRHTPGGQFLSRHGTAAEKRRTGDNFGRTDGAAFLQLRSESLSAVGQVVDRGTQ